MTMWILDHLYACDLRVTQILGMTLGKSLQSNSPLRGPTHAGSVHCSLGFSNSLLSLRVCL